MSEYTNFPRCGPVAARASEIEPFHVMELLTRAHQLQAQGHDIIHMEVGEPDFPTPEPVIQAAQHYLSAGRVGYTPAAGLPQLRATIAAYYRTRFGLDIAPERIVVTAGASAALMLTLAVLTEPGHEWLLPDPGYPCNRVFVRAFEGIPRALLVGPETCFQPTVEAIAQAWTERTRGLIVASPSNPTGTLIASETLAAIHALARARKGALIVDEIYQGLSYGTEAWSSLALGEGLFVINSFSKYFGMTGWRLGWLVAPNEYVREIEKLAQHFFISPSAPAQHAALAAFTPENIEILEARRQTLAQRRDTLLNGLRSLGFKVPAEPQGAFYIYADISALAADSFALAHRLLEEAGIATTPGLDFDTRAPERWLRFAYTTDVTRIEEALNRLRKVF
ncbi:MAG: pyridoxal phosphate-dependent aminotransferase [Betaproteobacteria bacterium]|nr:pyridoxal phosphate-dependent aminotransferase [Betaproteobacteria bacterium]